MMYSVFVQDGYEENIYSVELRVAIIGNTM